MKNKLPLISVFITLSSTIAFSQAPYWKLNGNPSILSDAVNNTNNFLGTMPLNNTPIRLGTQGRQRIYIDNTLNGISGNVGISTMFSTTIRPFSVSY